MGRLVPISEAHYPGQGDWFKDNHIHLVQVNEKREDIIRMLDESYLPNFDSHKPGTASTPPH